MFYLENEKERICTILPLIITMIHKPLSLGSIQCRSIAALTLATNSTKFPFSSFHVAYQSSLMPLVPDSTPQNPIWCSVCGRNLKIGGRDEDRTPSGLQQRVPSALQHEVRNSNSFFDCRLGEIVLGHFTNSTARLTIFEWIILKRKKLHTIQIISETTKLPCYVGLPNSRFRYPFAIREPELGVAKLASMSFVNLEASLEHRWEGDTGRLQLKLKLSCRVSVVSGPEMSRKLEELWLFDVQLGFQAGGAIQATVPEGFNKVIGGPDELIIRLRTSMDVNFLAFQLHQKGSI
ncbi:uncharacterized protein BDR25DRAFT_350578 [Lindgomyces ingoldianus]|uniref:Uncharacterized protein n=1 Tax=Lindgomyces ingoldianus TaxID=673940 RepID=A0ACB6R7Y5_9PLEO|nr:uncharacterized protein BDR25DRAFT_350578 [Lindgomyces ingoldianus]KAF2475170.1 hypothetical protein BDR25DRAFT_350578 [Lindgomyces ingoldianus]